MISALRRRILLQAAKLFDLALMVFSFGLATVLVARQTPATSLAEFLSMRIKVGNFALFALLLLAWRLVFSSFGLYSSKRFSTRRAEVLDIAKASTLGSAIIFVAAILVRIGMVTPLFILLFWVASTLAGAGSRVLLRYMLGGIRRRGRNLREMVVVGTNPRAIRFARKVEFRPELGYRIAGFVDDAWHGLAEFRKTGYPLVADFAGFHTFLREHVADEVMVALPMQSSYAQAARIAALCEEQGIVVRLLSDIFNLRLAQSTAGEFEGEAVTTLSTGSPENWQRLLKRTLDVSLSLMAMLLLSPLFLLATLLVKLTSPGSSFFVQERVGLNKRRFRLYKFRTMVANAAERQREIEHLNEARGPVFKIRNDPRLTPVGKFLRKTSIDELPQLFNVLKGEMSLVGPRPLPVRDYQGFDQDWQRRRFSVRPGITCLWQINGRSSIAFEKWMELDMEYIDHWSLGLDFKILAKTIPAVLKGAGAA
ncbi:MAG: sugar transferase [Terriglobia bacterium]|jgi:exopolysaccharide biosynthesis polyprenyl glycosylphosphotransferase